MNYIKYMQGGDPFDSVVVNELTNQGLQQSYKDYELSGLRVAITDRPLQTSGDLFYNQYMLPIVGTVYSIKDAIKNPNAVNIAGAGLSAILDGLTFGSLGILVKNVGKSIKTGKALSKAEKAYSAAEEVYRSLPSVKSLQIEAAKSAQKAKDIRYAASRTQPQYQSIAAVVNRQKQIDNIVARYEKEALAKQTAAEHAAIAEKVAKKTVDSNLAAYETLQDAKELATKNITDWSKLFTVGTAATYPAKTEYWVLGDRK